MELNDVIHGFQIPHLVVIILSLLGILFIFINSRNRNADFKQRHLMAIYPRIYFALIYIWFWLYSPPEDVRSVFARYGIVSILAVDLWIYYSDWFDYQWDNKWESQWKKLQIKLQKIKS